MLHKLKTGKLHTLLCLGTAVCLLLTGIFSGFSAVPAEAAETGVTDVIELNPTWGDGGLVPGRTYVTELTAVSSNEPQPEGSSTRTLSSAKEDTKSASYRIFYESPGDYWYTLTIGREGETNPIETYYVHVRVLYDAEGKELHASSTFRVGSKEAVKGDFNPEDPEIPETPSGTTSLTPTLTGTSKQPTVTPGTSITTSPGKTSAAKTGDASNALLYLILLAASAVFIFLIAENMRSSEK